MRREDFRFAQVIVKIHNANFKKHIKIEDCFTSLALDEDIKASAMSGKQMLSHMRLAVYNKPVNLKEIKQVKKDG